MWNSGLEKAFSDREWEKRGCCVGREWRWQLMCVPWADDSERGEQNWKTQKLDGNNSFGTVSAEFQDFNIWILSAFIVLIVSACRPQRQDRGCCKWQRKTIAIRKQKRVRASSSAQHADKTYQINNTRHSFSRLIAMSHRGKSGFNKSPRLTRNKFWGRRNVTKNIKTFRALARLGYVLENGLQLNFPASYLDCFCLDLS